VETNVTKQNTAVIGLGSMGWGAAISLLRQGYAPAGVDVRETVLTAYRQEGGRPCATAAEAAAEADVVLLFVVNAAQVRTVLFEPGGALETARRGTLFILCVTMAPSDTVEIAGRLLAAGMQVLDAPVSGGQAKALTGEITIMASGAPQAFDEADAVLQAISARVFRLGDEIGLGSKVKMVNQLLAGVHIAAAAEALTLAASAGLDLKMVYDVIRVSAGSSWMFENRGQHIVEGDYAPRSTVNIFVKDLGIVTGEAARGGAETPLSKAAHQLFREAAEAGYALEDDAAVAKLLAGRSGTALPGFDGGKA
jgi:3-hydroxyisobutyrate dehydrogenase